MSFANRWRVRRGWRMQPELGVPVRGNAGFANQAPTFHPPAWGTETGGGIGASEAKWLDICKMRRTRQAIAARQGALLPALMASQSAQVPLK